MTNMFDYLADAKMQVYFEIAKEKRRFFISPLQLQLLQKTMLLCIL